MKTVTIRTSRGEREYPAKNEYIAACQHMARDRMSAAHRDGWAQGRTSMPEEAAIGRAASEHYDMSTARGDELRDPSRY